jgi:hypothetical protein
MLIAVDTNVLFDLASDVEAVVDAIATIRKRVKAARFIVPPTWLFAAMGFPLMIVKAIRSFHCSPNLALCVDARGQQGRG